MEQLIFECMVKNLLEEYQFFPRYPEMQLKIAAILVGSLIKHQLLSNLTLGIAVCTVLEELCKPPDTKISAYGILALEQFLDRLVDLPLLCNHILQISHLHGTRVELIAFIEHTLARISSSHLISNGGSSAFTDPHSGSIPTTLEMVEMPDSSWQLVGPRSSQHGKQLSSSLPVQQIHQGLLGDRHKAHATSGIFSKPILPPGNSSNVSLSDIPNPQKNATGVPVAVLSSSSGFLHSSRAITLMSMLRQHSSTTGFGSALNIETLVAAAERRDTSIEGLIAQIPEIILKCISRDEAAVAVGQKVFKSLYEKASSSSHVSAHIAILGSIRDVCKLVVKELTSWVIYSNEERKFNRDIIVGLIHKDLLNLTEYNMHMAKLIDAGRNKSATEFAISLLQTLLIQESSVSVSELPNLVDVFAKVATRPGASDSLQQLVETARNPAAMSINLSFYNCSKVY